MKGTATATAIAELRESGMDDIMVKPVENETVLRKVKSYLAPNHEPLPPVCLRQLSFKISLLM